MADPAAKARSLRDKAQALLAADHFEALGLARTASADDVGRAFVQAAKVWHPDRVPAGSDPDVAPLFAKVFARLDLARGTLSDPSRRARYVEELAGRGQGPASNAEVSTAEASLEFRKAEALLKKNDATGAEKHLRRAVQLAPANVAFQALLISLQAQKAETTKDQLVKLASDLDKLIERDPECERAYVHRGQIRKRLDQLQEAHADFVRAVTLNPANVDAAREVRIFEMRKRTTSNADKGAKEEGGFFRKLFKR